MFKIKKEQLSYISNNFQKEIQEVIKLNFGCDINFNESEQNFTIIGFRCKEAAIYSKEIVEKFVTY